MSKAARMAICPGTFDPITYGHIDLIDRSLKIFDKVVVAVAGNYEKTPLFTLEERVDMIQKSIGRKPRVSVDAFDGLIVDYAHRRKAQALIRGVRMLSDFEYEFQMALTNRKLNDKIETIFLMPNESYAYVTSRLIKEISAMGGDVGSYVPPYVHQRLKAKLRGDGEI